MTVAGVTDIKNPEKKTSFKKNVETRNPASPGQVATKLIRLRRDNQYDSAKEAAVAAGIRPSILYKLERGVFHPVGPPGRRQRYGHAIASLAMAYGVKVEDILLISEEEDNRRVTA